MDASNDPNRKITITVNDLEHVIDHELDKHDYAHTRHESKRERVEGYLFMACVVISAVMLVVHIFTDWVPLLVGLPSARVIFTSFIGSK